MLNGPVEMRPLLTVKVGFTIEVELEDSDAEEASSAASSARTTAAARSAVAPYAKRIVDGFAFCLAKRAEVFFEARGEAGENAKRMGVSGCGGWIYVCPSLRKWTAWSFTKREGAGLGDWPPQYCRRTDRQRQSNLHEAIEDTWQPFQLHFIRKLHILRRVGPCRTFSLSN
jgi:hypothetical protein